MSGIKKRPHIRPPYPHVYVTIGGSEGAYAGPNGGKLCDRLSSDIKAINTLFSTQCSKEFGVVPGNACWFFGSTFWFSDKGRHLKVNAEEIDKKDPTTNLDINAIYELIQESNKNYDPDVNTNNNPPVSIIIIYVPGNYIANDSFTTGYAYDTKGIPYLIFLSDKATSDVLAHEVGHVLNYSNKNGRKNDPEPAGGDPDHNKNKGNLMYKEAGNTITPQQCTQFSESKIILRPGS
ncbi:M48 family metallopeptidase [Peribacillus butanolivorans]|uniref:hypothetical protein n=1 Tax=Peribacillus butanolivorans TaxID=421767 RepID=UPI0036DAC0FD